MKSGQRRSGQYSLMRIVQNYRQPFRRRAQAIEARAPAGLGVDELIQKGLTLGALVQGQLGGHHIVPGPVQKRCLPAAVGLGEQRLTTVA